MGGQIRLALVGDTMLGRGVAAALDRLPPDQLVDEVVAAEIRSADLAILNLECCLSTRGSRWPDPAKPFFFRGPPSAIGLLTYLGVNAVTLANNHALDYGIEALTDTLALLDQAGIRHVGAGPDRDAARRPCVLEAKGFRVGLVAFTDHPREYAASERQPGVAYADLAHGIPTWVLEAVATTAADAVVVTPHWGPNMSDRPVERVRRAAAELEAAGATLVAGHSAHVFQPVSGRVLFDLGDFIDDYARDDRLRNDLGLLWVVDLEPTGPRRLRALPLKLDYCHTGLAVGADRVWVEERFTELCSEFGTRVERSNGWLVVDWEGGDPVHSANDRAGDPVPSRQ